MQWGLALAALMGLLLVAPGGHPRALAQNLAGREYLLKAAFLYNFAKFVEWPTEREGDPGEPLTFCVLGEDPFGPVLETIVADKPVKGRAVVVRRIQGVGAASGCHLVFVSASEQVRLDEVLQALDRSAVLTVSDVEGFAQRGGVIGLFVEANKLRFAVNIEAAKRVGLRISSEMLKLARIVGKGE